MTRMLLVMALIALPARADCVVGRTEYGDAFASAVATERLFAVQFHPEKSQRAGFALLEAYARWIASCD